MITQITFSAFCDAFRDMGRDENFSYEGKRALFDYLEELEADSGEPVELDVIALCCDYYEQDLEGIIADYQIDVMEDDDDAKIEIVTEYLEYNSTLIAVVNGSDFVYAAF